MQVGCAKCGKEVAADQVSGNATAITTIFCGKCRRSAGRCVLCQKPVLGLFRWCPICSHGGHKECIDEWFSRQADGLEDDKPRLSFIRKKTLVQPEADRDRDREKLLGMRRNSSVVSAGGSPGLAYISCPSGCGHHCFSVAAPAAEAVAVAVGGGSHTAAISEKAAAAAAAAAAATATAK
jgi:hypothetical protein